MDSVKTNINRNIIIFTVLLSSIIWFTVLMANGCISFDDSLRYAANGKSIAYTRHLFPDPVSWDNFNNNNYVFGKDRIYPGTLFSLLLSIIFKIPGNPRVWHGLFLAYLSFVVGSCFCILFLKKFISGIALYFVIFLILANPIICSVAVVPLTDVAAWSLFMAVLWLSTFDDRYLFISGLLFGIAIMIRSPYALLAIFFPIVHARNIISWDTFFIYTKFVGGVLLSILLMSLIINIVIVKSDNTINISSNKSSYNDLNHANSKVNSLASEDSSFISWYTSRMHFNLKEQIDYNLKSAWLLFGPKSASVGAIFFILLLGVFSWDDFFPRHLLWYSLISTILIQLSSGIHLSATMGSNVIGFPLRYLMPIIPIIIPLFWIFGRKHFFREIDTSRFRNITCKYPLIYKYVDCGAVLLALFCVATLLNSFSGYSFITSIPKLTSSPPPVILRSFDEFENVISRNLPDTAVIATNNSEVVTMHHSTRNLIDISKESLDTILSGVNNDKIDAFIIYFQNNERKEQSALRNLIIRSEFKDIRNTHFRKIFENESPFSSFYVYTRQL